PVAEHARARAPVEFGSEQGLLDERSVTAEGGEIAKDACLRADVVAAHATQENTRAFTPRNQEVPGAARLIAASSRAVEKGILEVREVEMGRIEALPRQRD